MQGLRSGGPSSIGVTLAPCLSVRFDEGCSPWRVQLRPRVVTGDRRGALLGAESKMFSNLQCNCRHRENRF